MFSFLLPALSTRVRYALPLKLSNFKVSLTLILNVVVPFSLSALTSLILGLSELMSLSNTIFSSEFPLSNTNWISLIKEASLITPSSSLSTGLVGSLATTVISRCLLKKLPNVSLFKSFANWLSFFCSNLTVSSCGAWASKCLAANNVSAETFPASSITLYLCTLQSWTSKMLLFSPSTHGPPSMLYLTIFADTPRMFVYGDPLTLTVTFSFVHSVVSSLTSGALRRSL